MGSIPAHHGWRSGVYPFIFSTLQRSAGPKMLKKTCFSESVRKSLYFCNRKRNKKVFESSLTHWLAG